MVLRLKLEIHESDGHGSAVCVFIQINESTSHSKSNEYQNSVEETVKR